MVSVNADSKALSKGNQASQEQQQPRQAKQHSDPRDYLGMEKLVRRYSRPVEGRGEQGIEIEQGKWRDQEIRLVYIAEFHRFYAQTITAPPATSRITPATHAASSDAR